MCNKSFLFGSLGLMAILSGCEYTGSRETYQDCIIDKVSMAADAYTADMVREACGKKFQLKLPNNAANKVEGKARDTGSGSYHFFIDNRNKDWILTEIEIYIMPEGIENPKSFLQTVHIEPFQNGYFHVSILERENEASEKFKWGVSEVRGIHIER